MSWILSLSVLILQNWEWGSRTSIVNYVSTTETRILNISHMAVILGPGSVYDEQIKTYYLIFAQSDKHEFSLSSALLGTGEDVSLERLPVLSLNSRGTVQRSPPTESRGGALTWGHRAACKRWTSMCCMRVCAETAACLLKRCRVSSSCETLCTNQTTQRDSAQRCDRYGFPPSSHLVPRFLPSTRYALSLLLDHLSFGSSKICFFAASENTGEQKARMLWHLTTTTVWVKQYLWLVGVDVCVHEPCITCKHITRGLWPPYDIGASC